jgi:hypothetical protein
VVNGSADAAQWDQPLRSSTGTTHHRPGRYPRPAPASRRHPCGRARRPAPATGRRQGDTVRRSHPRPGRQGDRAAPLGGRALLYLRPGAPIWLLFPQSRAHPGPLRPSSREAAG